MTERTQPRTTRPLRSAPVTGASPLLRTGPPARPATVLSPLRFSRLGTPCRPAPRRGPASIRTRLLLFRAEAADRARVVYMPDTTWPVSGYPPGSSRSRRNTPVSMSSKGFGTSATIRSRSPSRSPPDASTGAFSSSLTTTVFSQRSMRRLEASLRRATPKGHETFISRTAPHQGLVPTSGPPCVQDTLRHAQLRLELIEVRRLPPSQNSNDATPRQNRVNGRVAGRRLAWWA